MSARRSRWQCVCARVGTFAPLAAGAGERAGGEGERRAVPLQAVGAAVRRVRLPDRRTGPRSHIYTAAAVQTDGLQVTDTHLPPYDIVSCPAK